MSRRYVQDLADGESLDEIYLLAERQLRANRNAETYLLAQLRDKTGQISGLMWNVSETAVAHIQGGDYVRVRGKVQSYQGNLQVILTRIEAADSTGLDAGEFLPAANTSSEEHFERLTEILGAMVNPDLRVLMQCFLADGDLVDALKRAPAGIRLHHAYQGGLLEHILNLSETALRIVDRYPKVDCDLLLAGIFLHDIGKVRELSFDSTFAYTDEGQLIGHLVIGVEMLTEKIREFEEFSGRDFPPETALRLKHMIVSHHGTYEFGSPKLPMTPEAIALHHLDNLDAKTNEFITVIEGDPNADSSWTPFQNNIQRKLFKGVG